MHSLLLWRSPTPLCDDDMQRLVRRVTRRLTFVPVLVDVWRSERGLAAALFFRSNAAGIEPLIEAGAERYSIMFGANTRIAGRAPVLADVRRLLDDPSSHEPRFTGSWLAATVADSSGVTALSDFSGMLPLYYGEDPELQCVATRPSFLKDADDGGAVDSETLAWLVGHSNVFGENAAYAGVRHLPPGRMLVTNRAGLRPVAAGDGIWPHETAGPAHTVSIEDEIQQSSKRYDSHWDQVAAELQRTVRDIFQEYPSMSLQLTGGKDSRLTLAAAHAAGLAGSVRTVTSGLEGSAEIECAAAVARRAGFEHEAKLRTLAEPPRIEDIWQRLRQHAFRYDAMICPWDGLTVPSRGGGVSVTGFGGELYRGGYTKHKKTPQIPSLEFAFDYWDSYHQNPDPLGCLQPHWKAQQSQYMRQWLERNVDAGHPLGCLPEKFYVEKRLALWNGVIAAGTTTVTRIYPLMSRLGAELCFRYSRPARIAESYHYELIRRLAPELLVPQFLGDTWSPHIRNTHPELGLPALPFASQNSTQSRQMVAWQWHFLDNAQDEIRALLMRTAADVDGIFDAKAVLARLEVWRPWTLVELKTLLSCVMIALYLSGEAQPVLDGDVRRGPKVNVRGVAPELVIGAMDPRIPAPRVL